MLGDRPKDGFVVDVVGKPVVLSEFLVSLLHLDRKALTHASIEELSIAIESNIMLFRNPSYNYNIGTSHGEARQRVRDGRTLPPASRTRKGDRATLFGDPTTDGQVPKRTRIIRPKPRKEQPDNRTPEAERRQGSQSKRRIRENQKEDGRNSESTERAQDDQELRHFGLRIRVHPQTDRRACHRLHA